MEVDPSFGTVDMGCQALLGDLDAYADGDYSGSTKEDLWISIKALIVDPLFETRASQNSALSHIDNVARKVCDGDYAAATKMAWSFLAQVDQQIAGQPVKMLAPFPASYAELTSMTFDLAWDPKSAKGPIKVPEGTFKASGGIGVVSTRKGGSVVTRNNEAAAVVDPGDYLAGDEVYVALSRTPDGSVQIPGFQTAFPAGFWIAGSQDPLIGSDGVLVQMCFQGPLPPNYGQFIKLAHTLDGGLSEILEDIEWATESDLITVDCTNLEPVVAALSGGSSGWLSSLTRWAGATVRGALTPSALLADVVGGTGLGGRTKSFSPFAPVDIYSSLSLTIEPAATTIAVGETVPLTATLHDPYGLVTNPEFSWRSDNPEVVGLVDGKWTGVAEGTTEVWVEFGPLPNGETLSASATITVLPLVELTVKVVNDADNAKEFRVFWERSYKNSDLECLAAPRSSWTCKAFFPATRPVTLKAETLWPTRPNDNVPGFDISIDPADLGAGCLPHQEGSGFATCDFDMRAEPFTITFNNLNGGGG